MKKTIQTITLILIICTNIFSQQNNICSDFENPNVPFNDWYTYNNLNGNVTNFTSNLTTVPNIGMGGLVLGLALQVTDVSGGTSLVNSTDYVGDYSNYQGNDCMCFDFKLITNGSTMSPYVILASGFDPTQPLVWGSNPTLAARFYSNMTVNPGNPWVTICAPLGQCVAGNLPSNAQGTWGMLGGASCADWQSLLTNVTDVILPTDFGWTGQEVYEVDNICILNCFAPTQDIGVTSIPSLDSTCFFTGNDTVTVQINNFGNVDVSMIEVAYQRFGDAIITETYTGTIPAGDSVLYTFAQLTDLSKSYNTSIKAWTNDPNDVNSSNDTTSLSIDCVCYDSLGTPYVCNQMVLKYETNTSSFTRDTIRQSFINAGIIILDSLNCDSIYLDLLSVPDVISFNGSTLIGAESQREAMKSQGAGKESIDLNFIGQGASISETSKYREQALKQTTELAQQNNHTPTDTIKIVVLDSGVDTSITSIKPYLGRRDSCSICPDLTAFTIGVDYINEDFDPSDDNNHGTHVTSIIAKQLNEQNIPATIIPIKVLDSTGVGSLWTICLGTVTAKMLEADIVNASVGWQGSSSDILDTLIDVLGENCHGLFVTSAGNDTTNNDTIPHWPSNYTYTHRNVISATAKIDSNVIAPYANYGSIDVVDVAVDGEYQVIDIGGGIDTMKGTSLSAAYVTGVAAGFLAVNEHLSAYQIKKIVRTGLPVWKNSNWLDADILVQHSFDTTDVPGLTMEGRYTYIDQRCKIHNCPSAVSITPIETSSVDFTVFPNPFHNRVTFEFELEEMENVKFWIYDVLGRPVFYTEKYFSSGKHQLEWNAKKLPNGTYIAYIQTSTAKGGKLLIRQD